MAAKTVRQLILSRALVWPAVLPTLTDRFGEELSHNVHLTGAQRAAWLMGRRTSAAVAKNLCTAHLDADSITAILEVEGRTTVVKKLVRSNDRPEAYEAFLGHPNGLAALPSYLRRDDRDPALLLDHLEHLPVAESVQVLASCPAELVDDAAAARHVAGIRNVASGDHVAVCTSVAALLVNRPGFGVALAQHRYWEGLEGAVAASPWITDTEIAEIVSRRSTGEGVELLAVNPWVGRRPDGSFATAAGGGERCLIGAPHTLDRFGLDRALDAVTHNLCYSQMAVPLILALATHPNLGASALRVSGLLADEFDRRQYPARRVFSEAVATFEANHPGLAPVTRPPTDPTGSKWYQAPPPELGPEHPNPGVSVFEDTPLRVLRSQPPRARDAALAHFSVHLGDHPEAWVTALLLCDELDGTLADLAAIAAATAAAPTAVAA